MAWDGGCSPVTWCRRIAWGSTNQTGQFALRSSTSRSTLHDVQAGKQRGERVAKKQQQRADKERQRAEERERKEEAKVCFFLLFWFLSARKRPRYVPPLLLNARQS